MHIRQRGKHKRWYLVTSGVDSQTGRRKVRFVALPADCRGKREAQQAAARIVAAMAEDRHVDSSRVTVSKYLTDRLVQWRAGKKISPRTAERYGDLINNQIIPHLGGIKLQKLKAADIECWHNTLLSDGRKDGKGGVSARTVGHAHRLLSKVLGEAQRFDLLVRNVATVEKPPKVVEEEIQIVSEERLPAVLERLKSYAVYPKAMLALFGGLRRGEVLALRWRHIDFDRKTLRVEASLEVTKELGIRVKDPKSNAGRREITMPDFLVDVLREHRKAQLELRLKLGLGKSDDDLLFPTIAGCLSSPRNLSAEWRWVARAIGVGEVTFHALRHTHASQLIDAGVDVVTISKRLGHSSPNITLRVYAHLFRQRDDKAAAAINAAIAKW